MDADTLATAEEAQIPIGYLKYTFSVVLPVYDLRHFGENVDSLEKAANADREAIKLGYSDPVDILCNGDNLQIFVEVAQPEEDENANTRV